MAVIDILPGELKARRKAKKMTQEELATLAGVSQTHIGNIEAARNLADIDVLVNIADVLDCQVDDLVRDRLRKK